MKVLTEQEIEDIKAAERSRTIEECMAAVRNNCTRLEDYQAIARKLDDLKAKGGKP